MNILSFTYWDQCHDTSAAIVSDGQLVAAAEEERFSRQKHDGRLPLGAIEFCLRRAGLEMRDVDVIAFPDKPFRSGPDSQVADLDADLFRRLWQEGVFRRRSLFHKRVLDALVPLGLAFNWGMHAKVAEGLAILRQRFCELPPVLFYEHHRAHAAAAYLSSGYERAAVITVDGRGGSYASATWSASGTSVRRLCAEPFNNSLGMFYRDCTLYLGLGLFGEGKTMGLAPYGDRESFVERVALVLETTDSRWYKYRRVLNLDILGFPPRAKESIVHPPYADFAATAQSVLETAVRRIAASAAADVKNAPLCLGGGVALNCACNGLLARSGIAPSVWVFPAAGDSGLSVGAALLCAADAGEFSPGPLTHAYWGPEFGPADCERALRSDPRIEFRSTGDIASEVTKCLLAGEVVGWFQGKMELGPRALGNRSILADPRRVDMRDRVNRLKGRELWRPLAPVVLAERAPEYFDLIGQSPFMLFATRVHPQKRAEIPAVVHVDGSARPQTVTRDQNPRLYDLLVCFARLSGTPVLLNTSFNGAGEPIVCKPEDAIETFLKMGLDVLVLGDCIVRRRQ